MKILVFDTESDGLAYEATKIHVMSWTWDGENYFSTADHNVMKETLNEADLLVCHNAIRHDLPLLNRILETTLQYTQFADTLALSWYLHFGRAKHGIESYGEDYKVPKPKVTDWHNLTFEEYAHRCEEDVKINWILWKSLHGKLVNMYGEDDWLRPVEYLAFKMDCAREQERLGWKLDVDKARRHYRELSSMSAEKEEELKKSMPPAPVYKTCAKPKVMYKQDGTLSAAGERWFNNLKLAGLPPTHTKDFKIVDSWKEGNPASTPQIKDWLFSLGWEPQTFKYEKEDDGSEREIPQVRYPPGHPDAGHLCESVLDLKEKDPRIEVLEGLTVINHRKAFFKALLDAEQVGYVKAEVDGLTNTWRFKHRKPLANIPGVDKPWGAEIRGCLIAPSDNHVLCGADMSSLESTTKRHYMMPYDPDYVEDMSQPGFDEHLDLAKHAGAISQEELDKHVSGEINLSGIRKTYKAANYSCIYGVGKVKFSRTVGVTQKQAASIIKSYWDRNWAIKKVSNAQEVKDHGTPYLWLKNPVSGIWHQLRFEKDIFSTLNQSTGVYCFDLWTKYIRERGIAFCGQFHDEHIAPIRKGDERETGKIYTEALEKANKVLRLNVPLGMDAQFGSTYAEIH